MDTGPYGSRALIRKLACTDPFANTEEESSSTAKDYVHIRIQQRNGKKSLTTIQVLQELLPPTHLLPDSMLLNVTEMLRNISYDLQDESKICTTYVSSPRAAELFHCGLRVVARLIKGEYYDGEPVRNG